MSKAFDKVWHEGLLAKLNQIGIEDKPLKLFKSYLENRKQVVVIDGICSQTQYTKAGIPQGSRLGPLLFLIYINDISSYVTSSSIRLFADDCFIYKNISSIIDSVSLQSDLDSIQLWSDHWLLKFNPSKCNIISFTNKKSPIVSNYFLNNISLS